MELSGKLAKISVSGSQLSANQENLEHVTDTVWRVADAAKRVLVEGITLERLDGTWGSLEYESVNLLTGEFTFATGYADTESIRVHEGFYLPMSQVATANDFSISKNAEIMPVPRFRDTHIRKIVGLKSATGTLSEWDVESTYFADALKSGEPVVVEFLPDTGKKIFRMWALLDSVEMAKAIDSPQSRTVSFENKDYF